MLKNLIEQLMQGEDLSQEETAAAVKAILSGAPLAQTAAFLVLLHAKGETMAELQGLWQVMHEGMQAVHTEQPLLDIVGTGGDCAHTVNISTAAAILATACGATVLKHGARAVSSRCGSADLLAAWGMPMEQTPEQVLERLKRQGFAFCFAPHFHPLMAVLKPVRQALAVRTSFNLLGPLLNPAQVRHILLGVYSPQYLELFADMLIAQQVEHAIVLHSCGLDELSLLGPAQLIEVQQGRKTPMTLDPKDWGFSYCKLSDIQGGGVEKNQSLLHQALSGRAGPIRDTIVLNTAAALYVADRVSNIAEGIKLASSHIQSGSAIAVIEGLASD